MKLPEKAATFVVAGFEPFAARSVNRSWEVVRRIPARAGLETRQLPVDFARLKEAVPRLMSGKPRGLLLVGEAPREQVCVEQVALNILDADGPDNAGATPRGTAIVPGGALALRTPWDARMVARKLNENGVGATASFHAGTFACNAALYLALHSLPEHAAVGFLHIPYRRWPFGLRMGLLLRAVEIGLEALSGDTR